MLELLVLKKYAECTSRRVKWTSGARDVTISFQQLPGPMFLKLLDFNIVFFTISFQILAGPLSLIFLDPTVLKFLAGPAPSCFSVFRVSLFGIETVFKLNLEVYF